MHTYFLPEIYSEMKSEQTTQRQTGLSTVKERVYSLENTSFAGGFIIISTTIS